MTRQANSLRSLPRKQRRKVDQERLTSARFQKTVRYRWINRALVFLRQINFPHDLRPGYTPDPPGSFFKGCWYENGRLQIVKTRCDVGELLHEAGHLALTPRDLWSSIGPGTFPSSATLGGLDPIGDSAVEAWDYAAAIAVNIPILSVFKNGFEGQGWLVWERIEVRDHPGFALLKLLGMSSEFGTCDRWYVGDGVRLPVEPEAVAALLLSLPCPEADLIVRWLKELLKNSKR